MPKPEQTRAEHLLRVRNGIHHGPFCDRYPDGCQCGADDARASLAALEAQDRDRRWLLKKAEAEDGCIVSVGGLVSDLEAMATPPAPPAAECAKTQALRSLANEAAGFLDMADIEAHGITNARCLHYRILEARIALAAPCSEGLRGELADERRLHEITAQGYSDVCTSLELARRALAQQRKATEEAQASLKVRQELGEALAITADDLAAELAEAVDALREIQWGNHETDDFATVYQLCPLCDQSEVRGHSPDCHVGASIAAYDVKHGAKS